LGFIAWGHAGYRRAGRDIVCAGVSALTTACLLGLEKYLPQGFYYRTSEDGFLFCRLKAGLDGEGAQRAQVIIGTMLRGLEEICRSYKNCVDIAYRR
jgi:uncharacterized protein YsxB (DUF464 family)